MVNPPCRAKNPQKIEFIRIQTPYSKREREIPGGTGLHSHGACHLEVQDPSERISEKLEYHAEKCSELTHPESRSYVACYWPGTRGRFFRMRIPI